MKQPHLSKALHWSPYCEHTAPPVFWAHLGKHVPLRQYPAPPPLSWQAELLPVQLDTQRCFTHVCPGRVQSLFDAHLSRSFVGFGTHVPFPSHEPPFLHPVPVGEGSVPQAPLRHDLPVHSSGWPGQSLAVAQTAVQSLSSRLSAPEGQQLSLSTVDVTRTDMHATSQELGDPMSFSCMHPRGCAQLVRQFPSQVSLPVVAPSPHRVLQSLSLPALAPGGQQASPFLAAVTGRTSHFALH